MDDEYITLNYPTISVVEKRKLMELFNSNIINVLTEVDYYQILSVVSNAIDRLEGIKND